jgi:hypothetical protein
LTRGIHNSLWTTFASTSLLINPIATLLYNPSKVRSLPTGPTNGRAISDWASQRYDLNAFLSSLAAAVTEQQCNDNSNLLTIFAGALGISVTPLWFANVWLPSPTDPTTRLVPIIYYGAGQTTGKPASFGFHQIVSYGGLVYDPSTRPAAAPGDPYMNISFVTYLGLAFPGHPAAGYPNQQMVTSITIGAVP